MAGSPRQGRDAAHRPLAGDHRRRERRQDDYRRPAGKRNAGRRALRPTRPRRHPLRARAVPGRAPADAELKARPTWPGSNFGGSFLVFDVNWNAEDVMLLPIAIAVVTITAALGVAYYLVRP